MANIISLIQSPFVGLHLPYLWTVGRDMLKDTGNRPSIAVTAREESVVPLAGPGLVTYDFLSDVRHLVQPGTSTTDLSQSGDTKTKCKKKAKVAAITLKAKDVEGHCGDRPIEELLTYIDSTSKTSSDSAGARKRGTACALKAETGADVTMVTRDTPVEADSKQVDGRRQPLSEHADESADSGFIDNDLTFTLVQSFKRDRRRRRKQMTSSYHYVTPVYTRTAAVSSHTESTRVLHDNVPANASVPATPPSSCFFTKSCAWVTANASLTATPQVTSDDTCSATSDLSSSYLSEVKDISETSSITESLLTDSSMTSSLIDCPTSPVSLLTSSNPPVVFVGEWAGHVTGRVTPLDVTFGFEDTLTGDMYTDNSSGDQLTFNYEQVVHFLKTRWVNVQQSCSQGTSRSIAIYHEELP